MSEALLSVIWDFLRKGTTKVYGRGRWTDKAVEEGFAVKAEATVPSCDGRPAVVTLHCPECGSSRLKEIPVWVHKCGELVYEKASCPKCGEVPLEELTYLGSGFKCLDCGSIINFPEVRTDCGDLNPVTVEVYELTDRGKELMNRVRRVMDSIPGPKAEFVWIDGLPIEILVPPDEAYIVSDGGEVHKARESLAARMGFKVRALLIELERRDES